MKNGPSQDGPSSHVGWKSWEEEERKQELATAADADRDAHMLLGLDGGQHQHHGNRKQEQQRNDIVNGHCVSPLSGASAVDGVYDDTRRHGIRIVT